MSCGSADGGRARAVFDALKHMTEGTDQLVHMLDIRSGSWCATWRSSSGVGDGRCRPGAGKRLRPSRRACVSRGLALAKIGTRGAAEPLRRALRTLAGSAHAMRSESATQVERAGDAARVAMEEEKDEAVVRELILALGRIGEPRRGAGASSSGRSRLVDFSGGSRASCALAASRGPAARGLSSGPGHPRRPVGRR